MKTILSFIAFLLLQIAVSAQTYKSHCDSTFKDTDGVLVHTCADKDPGFGDVEGDDKKAYLEFIDKNMFYCGHISAYLLSREKLGIIALKITPLSF